MFQSGELGIGLFIAYIGAVTASLPPSTAVPFSPGFDINNVLKLAQKLPSHSWEFGTASEALLELYDPSVSVFGNAPFPVPTLSTGNTKSLAYASSKIQIGSPPNVLANGDGSAGDPAALGVSAVLLGKSNKDLANAAAEQLDYLLHDAPRFWNGAISHKASYAELWADFIYMAPPFIAYYGAATDNLAILQHAVDQCALYRQILRTNDTSLYGAWTHTMGPHVDDPGVWSTGNGWAAAGMTRVLATVRMAPIAQSNGAAWQASAVRELSEYVEEILDVAMSAPTQGGLLINYWNDKGGQHGFGETSGSSLFAYVAYRIAVMQPPGVSQQKASSYVAWADGIRKTVGDHVTSGGVVTPAVDPLNAYDTTPDTSGSPEGQNFVVLMYAAWRDCVWARVCRRN